MGSARRVSIGAAIACALASNGCARPPLPAAPEAEADAARDAGAFLAVPPCAAEADYATGIDTVAFGFLGAPAAFTYDPKCLAIHAGDSVTFTGSFVAHPLYPSARRGTTANNPIVGVAAGDRTAVLFPGPGFFAYYCGAHGAADDGSAMEGVVWVR